MFVHQNIVEQVVRWTARILSILSTGVLMLFLFGEPFEVGKIRPVELVGLMLFPIGVVTGFVVAWWKEGLGGAITVASLFAFYLGFVSLSKGAWFLVFASPGFLFLVSWRLSHTRRALTI